MSSVVHRALLNVDILNEVFDWFARPLVPPDPKVDAPSGKEEERTLASAVLVCRAFKDPALRVLWSSLKSLFPLFSLLPSLKSLSDPERPERQYTYSLTDEIRPEDWSRFRQYARHVRSVRFDHETGGSMDHSFWSHLARQLSGDVLLPRLHALIYVLLDPFDTSLLCLLSPSIRHLVLYFMPDDERDARDHVARQEAAVDMLLAAVCTDIPRLDVLRLCRMMYPSPVRTAARGLQCVRTLDLTGSVEISDAETVRHLAEMPSLETIYCRIKLAGQPLEDIVGFPSLRELSVEGDEVDITQVCQCLSSPLEAIRITSHGISTLSRWQSQFAIIGPKCTHLKFLEIELEAEPSLDSVLDTLQLAAFLEHLLPHLSGLKRISIDADEGLEGDDGDCEALAKALPRVKSIYLSISADTSVPTPVALAHFARLCPSLGHLMLSGFDATEADWEWLLPDPLPVQDTLRWLRFDAMHMFNVDDPQHTGAIIAAMFPKLDMKECTLKKSKKNDEQEGARDGTPSSWDAGVEMWEDLLLAVAYHQEQDQGARLEDTRVVDE